VVPQAGVPFALAFTLRNLGEGGAYCCILLAGARNRLNLLLTGTDLK
jgi:hypothetical protein